jgi:hypothetical protein
MADGHFPYDMLTGHFAAVVEATRLTHSALRAGLPQRILAIHDIWPFRTLATHSDLTIVEASRERNFRDRVDEEAGEKSQTAVEKESVRPKG